MKSDDPRLKESLKRLTERVAKLDDMILTVLKNHVGVEQSMAEFLDTHGKNSEELTFAQKICACKELKPGIIEEPIWKLLEECNRLRNKVAHYLDGPEVEKKMQAVRDAYYATVSKEQAEAAKKMTDMQMAMSALTLCGSYIVVATENKKDADKRGNNSAPRPG